MSKTIDKNLISKQLRLQKSKYITKNNFEKKKDRWKK